MNAVTTTVGWALWMRWVIATAVGWVTGVLGAIILSNLVVNIFYPKETNLIVGLCMGVAIGAFQRTAARPWLKLSARWVWSAAIMMAPPFVLYVLLLELSLDTSTGPVQLALGLITVSGGVVGALLQARELRSRTPKPNWWVCLTAVSWGLALASERFVGFIGVGVVLGAANGGSLVWLLRANTTEAATATQDG